MFITYLLRELRRRMRQAIFIAAGLALGVGLVITVTAASNGVSATQGTVLHSLYGVGTDVTVTQSPAAGRPYGWMKRSNPNPRAHSAPKIAGPIVISDGERETDTYAPPRGIAPRGGQG